MAIAPCLDLIIDLLFEFVHSLGEDERGCEGSLEFGHGDALCGDELIC